MKTSEAIALYIRLRDKKSEIKDRHTKELAPLDEKMQKIEAALQKRFNKLGEESARTTAGTAFVSRQLAGKVVDRDAFLEFVKENDAYDFLENKVNTTAVQQYIDEHEEPPPGIDVNIRRRINVRRK